MYQVLTRRKRQQGFTLIELAIIIAVLAILGSVGAVKLASMNADAQKSAAMSDLANLRSALAVAIAKSTTGTVTAADVNNYLEPNNFDGTSWNGYTVTVQASGSTIVSVSKLVSIKDPNITAP